MCWGAIRATCANLADGLRHRNIMVAVASAYEMQLLTRAQAGDRGAPYRDLLPRVQAREESF